MVIVGNKADLEDQRAVARTKAFAISQKWGAPYYEASARTRSRQLLAGALAATALTGQQRTWTRCLSISAGRCSAATIRRSTCPATTRTTSTTATNLRAGRGRDGERASRDASSCKEAASRSHARSFPSFPSLTAVPATAAPPVKRPGAAFCFSYPSKNGEAVDGRRHVVLLHRDDRRRRRRRHVGTVLGHMRSFLDRESLHRHITARAPLSFWICLDLFTEYTLPTAHSLGITAILV